MSRIHALYKMVAIVQNANIVRGELGLPEVRRSPPASRAIRWRKILH
jgi:hypothetical protein